MNNKRERQDAIRRLIGSHDIGSQEELRQLLADEGQHVTQATLSRDLRGLGVVRATTPGGARYLLRLGAGDDAKLSIANVLPQWFSHIDGVSELIVLHTLSGGAQPVSEAIDSQGWPEVLGTVAGENTILIICRSAQARLELTERLIDQARGE